MVAIASSLHHHSSVGIISSTLQISPLFKKNFLLLQKFGEKRHAFEVLPVPFPVVPWVAPKPEHRPTNFRIDDGESLWLRSGNELGRVMCGGCGLRRDGEGHSR